MRIHGIHVQGLRSPQGHHELAFEPGYNVSVFPGDGQALGLARLVAALLYPDVGLADAAHWQALGGGERARAALALSFGPDAYRLVADFAQRRVALARFDAVKKEYARVATEIAEIGRLLRAAGLPRHESFVDLHCCGDPDSVPAPPPAPPPVIPVAEDPEEDEATAPLVHAGVARPAAPAPEPAPPPPAAPAAQAPDAKRLKDLRALRDRVAALERDCAAAASHVAERGALGEVLDGLDEHLRAYRGAAGQREAHLAEVEEARRVLLDERNQLRSVPDNQRSGLLLSLGLVLAGGVAGAVVDPVLSLLALFGVGTAVFAMAGPRVAQRKIGNVEARLSSLRVKERTIERRFESQTAEIAGLLKALKLTSIDDLEQAVEDYQRARARVTDLETKRSHARAGFPRELQNELRALEEQAARASAPPPPPPAFSTRVVKVLKDPPRPPAAAAAAPAVRTAPGVAPGARTAPSPNLLMKLGEGSTRRPAGEVRSLLGTSLPIYLRALTDGRWSEGRRLDNGTWGVRGERIALVSVDEVPAEDHARVSLAFRLALLEVLSPALRVPLIAGPGLSLGETNPALARVLRRVANAVQVIQVVAEDGPWVEQAEAVQRPSA